MTYIKCQYGPWNMSLVPGCKENYFKSCGHSLLYLMWDSQCGKFFLRQGYKLPL